MVDPLTEVYFIKASLLVWWLTQYTVYRLVWWLTHYTVYSIWSGIVVDPLNSIQYTDWYGG